MAGDGPPSSFTLSPPNKRLKSRIKEDPYEQEAPENEERCGICMSGYGQSIRGRMDSCDHFFCFVCILQWAKTESRCPTCRRRFSTILRPPKPGLFPTSRLVNIPIRDQVYHPHAHFDPYGEVKCSVCQEGEDASVLLLCDLCDTGVHTYCIGLGATIPEGDWFCDDCTASRTEYENSQKDNDVDNKIKLESSDVFTEAQGNVSPLDIVCESYNTPFLLPQRRVHRCLGPHGRQPISADEIVRPREITPQTLTTQTQTRTLSRCRDVNTYIRALRENWGAIQKGSLSFSSDPVESSCESAKMLPNSSDQPHSSSSSTAQQMSNVDGFSGHSSQGSHSHDIDKAWRMMDKATKFEFRQGSKYPSGRGNPLKAAPNGIIKDILANKELLSNTIKKQYLHCADAKETQRHISPRSEKKKWGVIKERVESYDGLPCTYSTGSSTSTPSCKVHTRSQGSVCLENGTGILQKNLHTDLMNISNEKNGSYCCTLVGSLPERPDLRHAISEFSAASSHNVYVPESRDCLEKSSAKSKVRNDAKSEIQSLVRRNLKLLSRDKQLGVAVFKEVARRATHTILAVCGLGHPDYARQSFSSSICRHSVQLLGRQRSSLVPSSCSECFHVFVKDVVKSSVSEKVYHTKSG